MKPGVPETGTVLNVNGGDAVIALNSGGQSCRKCGARAMGLCGGAGAGVINVRNDAGARVGDTVLIGLSGKSGAGFLFAYILPLFAFVLGAALGRLAGIYFNLPFLDVAAGFVSLSVTLFFALKRLRKLDSSSRMVVKKVFGREAFNPDVKSDEELRYEQYARPV